jgi:hypothetical protein
MVAIIEVRTAMELFLVGEGAVGNHFKPLRKWRSKEVGLLSKVKVPSGASICQFLIFSREPLAVLTLF